MAISGSENTAFCQILEEPCEQIKVRTRSVWDLFVYRLPYFLGFGAGAGGGGRTRRHTRRYHRRSPRFIRQQEGQRGDIRCRCCEQVSARVTDVNKSDRVTEAGVRYFSGRSLVTRYSNKNL
jgi:hypothetical protein